MNKTMTTLIPGALSLVDSGGAACACPPVGSNSFVFTDIFTEKCLRQRLAPPLMARCPLPTGNPGSATVYG